MSEIMLNTRNIKYY